MVSNTQHATLLIESCIHTHRGLDVACRLSALSGYSALIFIQNTGTLAELKRTFKFHVCGKVIMKPRGAQYVDRGDLPVDRSDLPVDGGVVAYGRSHDIKKNWPAPLSLSL